MKKSLLIAAAALVSGTGFAQSTVDPATYEEVDGLVLKNRVLLSETNLGREEFGKYKWMTGTPGSARTACTANLDGKDVIVISQSAAADGAAAIHIIDLATGEYLKTLSLTVDGAPLSGTLCANTIGCDDFNHVWVVGYAASTWVTPKDGSESYGYENKFYTVDLKTGALTLAANVALTPDDAEANGRVDYFDLVGDITRTEGRCAIAAVPTVGLTIYGWEAEQGGEFVPMFEGYAASIIDAAEAQTCPAEQTAWGTAPVCKIVKNDAADFSAQMFYIDGMSTAAVLYDRGLQCIDGFMNAESGLVPKLNINGICDIAINGKKYVAYPFSGHSGNEKTDEVHHETYICALNDAMEFSSLKKLWTAPAAGLGNHSDGGTRVYPISVKIYKDENGVEGAYILLYKCMNGFGVYTMAPKEWIDPNGDAGVEDIIADDNNAPVEYFNLNGVKVNGDLAPGLYITRQGNKVAKKVVK